MKPHKLDDQDALAEGYRLTDAFPYLLARAGARMAEKFSQELAEVGMTLPMYRVLAALWERDRQKLTELAAMVDADVSTLSRLISSMRKDGFLSSERLEHDARSVCIRLTERGRKQLFELIPRARWYEEIALVGLSKREIDLIKDALRRIHANLVERSE